LRADGIGNGRFVCVYLIRLGDNEALWITVPQEHEIWNHKIGGNRDFHTLLETLASSLNCIVEVDTTIFSHGQKVPAATSTNPLFFDPRKTLELRFDEVWRPSLRTFQADLGVVA
jgi:hypothetical protein